MGKILFYPGEQEGGTVRRATDPIWSTEIYPIKTRISQYKKVKGKRIQTGPTLYYIKDGPKRGFTREALQIVPKNTESPPSQSESSLVSLKIKQIVNLVKRRFV